MNSETSETAIEPSSVPAPGNAKEDHDLSLTEDLTLALLHQRDLPSEEIEKVAKGPAARKSRKVRFALASHPRSPRHISQKLVREFHTFDLMRYALTPGIAADLKLAADALLVSRLASITLGERISLARRSSETVCTVLLLDKEARVWRAALENPRLTESAVVKALLRRTASPALVEAICHHAKWSPRHEVRIALLRNGKTPLARALEMARALSPAQLRDILHSSSNLPQRVKAYLRKELEIRK
jgi:hypothetical protein